MISLDFSVTERLDQKPILEYKYRPITRKVGTFKEELFSAATQIKNSSNKEIYCLLSGGIDSEIVARSFVEQGYKIRALSIRYKHGENSHDIEHALNFCRKFNIKHEYVNLDIDNFLKTYPDKIIKQGYNCTSYYDFMMIYLLLFVEQRGGLAVSGAAQYDIHTLNNEIVESFQETRFQMIKWVQKNSSNSVPFFLRSTPELVASYINDPLMQYLTRSPNYFPVEYREDNPEKILIYHYYFPDMIRRPKFHGFENVYDKVVQFQRHLRMSRQHLIPLPAIKKISDIRLELGV